MCRIEHDLFRHKALPAAGGGTLARTSPPARQITRMAHKPHHLLRAPSLLPPSPTPSESLSQCSAFSHPGDRYHRPRHQSASLLDLTEGENLTLPEPRHIGLLLLESRHIDLRDWGVQNLSLWRWDRHLWTGKHEARSSLRCMHPTPIRHSHALLDFRECSGRDATPVSTGL